MELRDVRVFLTLADELHFGRTAERLHLTQGRVSQTIRALERQVGGKLFERTSRQVRLTPLGRRFGAGARLGYDTLAQTLRDCQAMAREGRGRLRIGYAATIGGDFAAGVAAAFEAHCPDCTTTVNAVRTFRADLALDNGEADILLAWSPGGDGSAMRHPELTVGPVLAEVPRGVLVPDDHPLTAHREISLEDLVDYELLWPPETLASADMRDLWIPRFTPSGRPLKRAADDIVTMTGRSEVIADDVIMLVARQRGLHFTVTSLMERQPFPGLTVIPISDMPPMAIVPIWSATAQAAPVRSFAGFVATFRPRRAED